jgi:hypothetical protein
VEDVPVVLVGSDPLGLVDPLLRAIRWEVDVFQTVDIDGGGDEGLGVFLSGVQEERSVSLVQSKGVTVDLGFDGFIKEESVCRGRGS